MKLVEPRKSVERLDDIGIQRVYRFANGYGASVVKGPYSYGGPNGLYELAVIKFYGDGDYEFKLNYDTPITSDVIGHLTLDKVNEILDKIEKL